MRYETNTYEGMLAETLAIPGAEHALNIDFVNETLGPGARVAVELDAAAARRLVQTVLAVLDEAEAGGFAE